MPLCCMRKQLCITVFHSFCMHRVLRLILFHSEIMGMQHMPLSVSPESELILVIEWVSLLRTGGRIIFGFNRAISNLTQ